MNEPSSLPLASVSTARPSKLAERYAMVRAQTMALAAPLTDEDAQVQAMPDASPAKWHLAHLTWFFETFILERFEPGFAPFDASFRVLFNSYYQGIGEQHPRAQRGLITRPSFDDVKRYRAQVDARVQALLAMHDEVARKPDGKADLANLADLIELGLQHEQQHQELLLTDIKYAFSRNPIAPAFAKRWPMAQVQPQPLRWFRHAGGLVECGHEPARDGDFAFDNETPRHRVYLVPFEIASRPATNGDYLAFIEDGGYSRPEFWLAKGWDWLHEGVAPRQAPLYWQRGECGWESFTLQGMAAIDRHTPVCHLSYFEAEAFARWAGARLPTEFEWEHAVGTLKPLARDNFADRGAFHPLPQTEAVHDLPLQMFGDVWEWTSSAYAAYPGYRPLPGAVGEYNGKFMCDQFVLRGGSCATPFGHVRASYRNFFPATAQWQFTGLRLARDA